MTGVAQDKAAVSDTHLQIAAVHGKRGDTSAMLRYFESALSLRDEAMASHHTQTALIYNGIGNVRLSQGKHATAIDAFSKALEIDEELRGASDRELPLSFAAALSTAIAVSLRWSCLVYLVIWN